MKGEDADRDFCFWPLGAVTLDRLGTTAIEGTADQSRVSRWLIAVPKLRPSAR
jgi:hypothetical protein